MNAALLHAKKYIYDPMDMVLSQVVNDPESKEYSACSFMLNGKKVIFRSSKITPTKIGQFVTLWKRDSNDITILFDCKDDFDAVIIQTSLTTQQWGQFIFSKDCLVRYGIISQDGKGGKRGFRLYPTWDAPDNKQAQRTQQWQKSYFFEYDSKVALNFLNYYSKIFV